LIINGLGLEGWLPRLVQSSGGKAVIVTASDSIAPRQLGSDPHAGQSVINAKRYVVNIRNGLSRADPEGVATYNANAQAYLAKLDRLDREVRETAA
jgi:zinc/manganese transport system substrate-binding protein